MTAWIEENARFASLPTESATAQALRLAPATARIPDCGDGVAG
jgi:hypothetical protein